MLEPISCATDQAVPDTHKDLAVLVVGSDRLVQRVEQLIQEAGLACQLQVVPECLMALGQVVAETPDVILIHRESLDDSPESIVQALRTLVPRARLLLWDSCEPRSGAKGVVAGCFDGCLTEPVDAQQLSRALGIGDRLKPSEPGFGHDEDSFLVAGSLTGGNQALDRVVFDPLHELEGDPDMNPSRLGPSQVEAGLPHDQGAVEAVLIQQLLRDRRGLVCPTALRAIETWIGVGEIGWSESKRQVPEGHVSVPVGHGDVTIGLLHAPAPVGSNQLQPWAAWLGPWLALDRHVSGLWQMAMGDEMTGLWNRRYFNRFLNAVLNRAADRRFYVSLLVFDIDDFKIYNDRYGHLAGDDILRETARLIQSLVREHDVVARIGGDEFAVIFWDHAGPRRSNSAHPYDAIQVAQRFQRAICSARFPKLGDEAPGTLTISGGLAGFPWDGHTPEGLLDVADKMAMQSKRQGKNAIMFGPGAQRVCADVRTSQS